jgi:V/A-type H+-transporting ATPase subunit K
MVLSIGTGLAIFGAGLAIGLPGIASAIGLGAAGKAAAASVAENPENATKNLILQALPQTQTIYGFITALLIAMGVGLLSGTGKEVDFATGLVMFGAGLLVGLTGLSAIIQGMVSASGIAATARTERAFVPSIMYTGQVETPAIFGFTVAFLILAIGLKVIG